MATISELNVRLGLITRDFDRNLGKVERQLRTSAGRLSRLGSDLTVAISAPLAAFGASSIKAAGDTEALTLALQAQLGSAQAARVELEALRKEALKPGLGFEQAVRGSVSLQAVGLTAEDARKTVSNFGNALALAGKGKAELDGVVLALTQISAKGKVSAEEINQLAERLPQIRTLLKQAFGTADTEKLQELGVTSEQFIEAINKELEKLPQATGGIKNSIENVGDSINQFLAGIGQDIAESFDLKQLGEDIASSLGAALKWFQRLDDGTKQTILQFGLVAVALGPVIKIIGVFQGTIAQGISIVRGMVSGVGSLANGVTAATTAFKGLSAASKAFVLIGVATAIFYALDALGAFNRELSTAEKIQQDLNAVTKEANASIAREKSEVDLLVGVLKNENISREQKAKALSKLQGISPQYFGQLREENGLVVGLQEAYDGWSASIIKAAKAQAARERLVKISQDELDLDEEHEKTLANLAKRQAEYNKTRREGSNAPAGFGDVAGLKPAQDNVNKSIGLDDASLIKKAEEAYKREKAALDARKKALSDVIQINEQVVDSTNDSTDSTNKLGDGLTKKMKVALEQVANKMAAFDERVKLYGQTADTASQKTKLIRSSIDKLLNAGFSATSEQVQRLRAQLDGLGGSGDGLSKKMKTALSSVTSDLAAFDERVKLYGPSVETAEQKNQLLADSIDKLLKAGFSATSEQVGKLKDELAASNYVTDEAKKKYLELLAAWSKPVEIKGPVQSFANLPQANPLGVGGQPSSNSPSADPIDTVSIDQVTEGLVSINSLSAAATNQFNSFVAASQKGFGGIQQAASNFYQYWGNTINNVYGAASQLGQNLVALEQANSSAKIKTLEGEYAKRIAAAEGDSARQEALQAELNAKKEALQKKAAKNAKRLAIITAIIDTAQGVTKALGSAPPPINFIMAGLTAAAGAIQIATIKAQPLAKGGVATSPTLALVGEYPGAKSNPEIIAPENKLRAIFRQEQGGNMELSTRISGSDLLILLERAGNKTKRTRGY